VTRADGAHSRARSFLRARDDGANTPSALAESAAQGAADAACAMMASVGREDDMIARESLPETDNAQPRVAVLLARRASGAAAPLGGVTNRISEPGQDQS